MVDVPQRPVLLRTGSEVPPLEETHLVVGLSDLRCAIRRERIHEDDLVARGELRGRRENRLDRGAADPLDDLSVEIRRELAVLKIFMVGLDLTAAAKYPNELSGGMQKRASLARALSLEPKILFLDEPTAGLDPISASQFDELVRYLGDNLDLTIVMITHDVDTLFGVCDRVAVLVNKGIVVDTVDEIVKHPDPWIQEYFGDPRAVRARRAAIAKVKT